MVDIRQQRTRHDKAKRKRAERWLMQKRRYRDPGRDADYNVGSGHHAPRLPPPAPPGKSFTPATAWHPANRGLPINVSYRAASGQRSTHQGHRMAPILFHPHPLPAEARIKSLGRFGMKP